jgi:hypothetical protein
MRYNIIPSMPDSKYYKVFENNFQKHTENVSN